MPIVSICRLVTIWSIILMRKKKRVKPAQLVFFRENWVEPAQPGIYEKTKRVEPAAPESYKKVKLHPIFSKKKRVEPAQPELD